MTESGQQTRRARRGGRARQQEIGALRGIPFGITGRAAAENSALHVVLFGGGMDTGAAVIEDTARVVGDVSFGRNVYVLYGAVLRADHGSIRIGDNSNVQDNVVMHCDPGHPVIVGKNVSIGHGAVVHGCTVGDNTIVGMHAVILNGAVIGRGCVIGAGAVVAENMVIPDHSLVVGVPGKVKRTDPAFEQHGQLNAEGYLTLRAARIAAKTKAKL